jgi:hypothetical protein
VCARPYFFWVLPKRPCVVRGSACSGGGKSWLKFAVPTVPLYIGKDLEKSTRIAPYRFYGTSLGTTREQLIRGNSGLLQTTKLYTLR